MDKQRRGNQIVGPGSQQLILSEFIISIKGKLEAWHTYLLMRLPSPLARAYA